jgi:3',5'-cyclic-AMP phosphodiesterase
LTLLAQLSDPHVVAGPGDTASADALAAAVRAVLRLDPAPDAVLVSGDVTNTADAASYARAAEVLAPLPMPVHVLAGNHDDRAALRAAFPLGAEVAADGDAPYRWTVRCGALRLVGCDTTVPGSDAGRFGAESIAWLSARLAEEPLVPTIVAMHHPPVAIGIAPLDAIGLPDADGASLAGLLAGAPQVRRVVCGHVHRAAAGALGGLGVFTCPSVYMQADLDLSGDASAEIVLAPGAAAFGVHVLTGDGEIVSHVAPVD